MDDLFAKVLAEMDRLDPKHERIFIHQDENGWLVTVPGKLVIHPQSFLDVCKDIR